MIRLFRAVALIEGVTTLVLFLIAMPLKYWFGYPALIRPSGWTHGFAFIAYVAVMPLALILGRAGPIGWLRTLAAAFVPFGTFLNDRYVHRLIERRAARVVA